MKVALISYEPDNYDPDELDDLQVYDFDKNDVHIYDLNKVDEKMIDYIVSRACSCTEHGLGVLVRKVEE